MFSGVAYYLKLCFKYNKKYPVMLLANQLFVTLQAVVTLLLPKYILDYLFSFHDVAKALTTLVVFLISVFVLGSMQHLFSKQILNARMETFRLFQVDLSQKLMAAPLERVESKEFLDLKSKADQYIYGGGSGFGSILESAVTGIGSILQIGVYMTVIAQLHIFVLIALFVLVLVNILLNAHFQKKTIAINLEKAAQERHNQYYMTVFQDFTYGKEIRANSLAKWLSSKYNAQLEKMRVFYRRLGNNNFLFGLSTVTIGILQQAISYGYLIFQAIQQAVTVGQFTMILTAITSFSSAFKEVANTLVSLGQYTDYYKAYKQYIDACGNSEEHMTQRMKLSDDFSISFINVSFKYSGSDSYALRNVSVTIHKWDTISIVGKNGAGKSTFVKLLLRLYKPTEGVITINDTDISTIAMDDYLSLFSTVFQDFKLFAMPISDNILLAQAHDVNAMDKCQKSLERVDLQDKVQGLNEGCEQYLYKIFDESGFTPSGGEAQKLAFARALARDAQVLVLDEPTASLDPEAEFNLYNLIASISTNSTSLFISHRLSSTKLTKRILVFDHGEIVEDGTHDDLVSNNGLYSQLYEMQAYYYVN